MTLLEKVEQVIHRRDVIGEFYIENHLDNLELEELKKFLSVDPILLKADILEEYFDILGLLTPSAFNYYLLIVIRVSLVENEPRLLMVQSLVNMLDRSPAPESWDEFYITRWPELCRAECEVVGAWLVWLAEIAPDVYSDHTISRAIKNIELILEGYAS